jgi:hypothetical protein
MTLKEYLQESNKDTKEKNKLRKEYGETAGTSIHNTIKKHDKVIEVDNPIKYALSNPKFLEAVRAFYKKPEMKAFEIKEKSFSYDKKTNEVTPGSWDS